MVMVVEAKSIASYLGLELVGGNVPIGDYAQLSDIRAGAAVFAKRYSDAFASALNAHSDIVAIVASGYTGKLRCSHIISSSSPGSTSSG